LGTGGTAASNAWGGTGNGSASFTVKANAGYTLNLTQISAYNVRRSSAGATTGQWAYSLDGTTFVNIGSAITWGSTTTSSGNAQPAITLSSISALQNLPATTTVTFRVTLTGATTGTWYLNQFQAGDDFVVTGTVNAAQTGPAINTTGSLTPFSTTAGTASAAQTFNVTGAALTADITVTAPTDFEVSTDGGATFGDTVTITQSSGSASGTVSVRIKASATAGSKSGNIVLSSVGATSVSVPVSGLVESASAVPIVTATNFTGQVSVAFSNSITASGAPTNFVVTSGTLPGGLALNAVTGLISGTPTNAVTNNVSVTAQNANGTSDPATIGFAIAKGNQTITFAALPTKVVGDADFSLSATASSGLPVSYTSSSNSVATVSSNIVTIVGAGSTVITSSQAGDDNWNAATNVVQTLLVLPNNVAYWNFNGAAPVLAPAGWTFGSVSQGNNNGTTTMLTTGSASSGYTNVYGIAASGSTNAQAAARTGVLNTETNGSAYFEFNVTAPAGNTNISITNISFGNRSTGTGPAAYSIRSSADNYAANLPGGSGVLATSSSWVLLSAPVSVLVTNGATQTFRIYGHGGTGSASVNSANWRIDDLTVGFGIASSSPSIVLTPSALSGLSTFAGTPSAASSYALVGTNLTNDVVVTPTTSNLEISTNNLNFTNELTLPLAGGAVSNTTLFVRISSAAPVGTLSNAAVRHVSTDLTNDVTVAGNVYDPSRGTSTNSLVAWDSFTQTNFGPSPWAPTVQASNLIVSNGLTRGSGVLTTGGAAARGWGGVDWSSPDAAAAVASDKVATFTVAATNGYALSVSSISKFDYRRSSSGPLSGIVQVQIGTNDFANVASVDYANSASSGASIPSIDLSTNVALQNIPANTPVTFRIVNFGGTNTTGTWYIYDVGNNPNVDFEVSGSVAPASATPPTITSTNAFSGTVGAAFSNDITATGDAPIAFSGTALPGGLSVASGGAITGTPTAAGTFNATLTATNAAGTNNQAVTFTIATGAVSITTPPTASGLVEGQTLASSTLSGGSASVVGTFAWTDSSIIPPVGTTSYGVTFTPTDAANYNTATTNASVTVLSAYQAGYTSWLTGYQLDPLVTTGPTAGAPNADPDNDGFRNASEYAFGTNPTVPNGALLTTTSSNSVFRSSWAGPASGVTYGVQFSTNLSTMAFSNDPTITIESVGGVMSFTNQATGNKFFRVRATSN
jgi:hypothetical protein